MKDQKYTAALADEDSLIRAARCLNLPQPAFSKWLLGLEQEIGMPLMIRSGNNLIFTEAGQTYLGGYGECLETALETHRELDASSQKSKQNIILGGSLIKGAQASVKVYSEFYHKYPDIDLQFVSDKNPVFKKTLSKGRVTMSLLGAIETSLSNLECLKFADEELLVMLPKGHPLSYDYKTLPPNQLHPAIDLANLASAPILTAASEASYGNMVLTLYRNAGLESNITFRSSVTLPLYEAVLNGVSATMTPDPYYNPEDDISVYSSSPRIIVYREIGL